jgi:hypothetical protein
VVDLDGRDGKTALAIKLMISNPDEAGGVAERKRANEKGVDDAEDGAASADPEADDKNGEGREAEVAAEGAEGVLEVAREGVQPSADAGWFVGARNVGHESLLGGIKE